MGPADSPVAPLSPEDCAKLTQALPGHPHRRFRHRHGYHYLVGE